ncbi:MAG: glycoside hydrolase [Clostridia bacterium]|nr:glycoside hydrolase [Clostridia bacterium]
MGIKLIGEPVKVMCAPYTKHNYFAWPSIERLKNGRIAVACSGFRLEHICPFGKAVICFSDDECESFSPPAPVIDTPLDDRDTGLCAFGDASLIVTSFNNTVEFQRSCNPENVYIQSYLDTVSQDEESKYLGSEFRISGDNGVTFGDIHISPVTSPHGPCVLKDGTLLWVGRSFGTAHEEEGIKAYTVKPDGETVLKGQIENVILNGEKPLLCEPHAVQLDNGDILCHIRAEGNGVFTTYQSVSRDGALTWSKPQRLLDLKGGAPAHLLVHPSGTIISVYGYREKPYGIKAMISTDNGETWEKDIDININGVSSDIGYPATVCLSDGNLFTVFYAHESKNAPAEIFGQKWCL